MTDYIHFCKDNVFTQKSITMYPNNKPYISKEIKECLVQKKMAFKSGDLVSMRNKQKVLNHKLWAARRKEREKFGSHCSAMNTKELWDSESHDEHGSIYKVHSCVKRGWKGK